MLQPAAPGAFNPHLVAEIARTKKMAPREGGQSIRFRTLPVDPLSYSQGDQQRERVRVTTEPSGRVSRTLTVLQPP